MAIKYPSLSSSTTTIIFIVFISLILFSSASLAYSFNTAQAKQNDITITHGIASGDVTNHSAVIWSKSNTDSIMHTKYDTNPNFINPNISNRIQHVNNSIDYSGVVKLDNLKPNTILLSGMVFASR